MRICYLLLSPTFGMHQYTADLANQRHACGHEVHLVTTKRFVADRYAPDVQVHAPVDLWDTGLSVRSLDLLGLLRVLRTLTRLSPDVVHITGPHIWNGLIMRFLRRWSVPIVHTIHDVEPHAEGLYGCLVRRWNRSVLRRADHVLVHGQRYVDDLAAQGVAPTRITCSPLLHLFTSYAAQARQCEATPGRQDGSVLFFGRLEAYKGIPQLLSAWSILQEHGLQGCSLVLAGRGPLDAVWSMPLPDRVILHNRHIPDQEAERLLAQSSLLVLPYVQATQSALVAAAYAAARPVIVSDSGALAEYVVPGVTGWVVPAGDVPSLAATLRAALQDRPKLGKMGQAGRAWYERERVREQALLSEMYAQLAG